MKMPKSLLPLTIMFAAAIAQVPTTAAALPDNQTRTATVQHSDLDLTRRKDRDALDARINRAAWRICRHHFHLQTTDELQCLRKAVRSARPQRNAAIARALQPIAAGEWWISPKSGAVLTAVFADKERTPLL